MFTRSAAVHGLRGCEDFPVLAGDLAVQHQHPAVADRGLHGSPAAGIDEIGGGVMKRRGAGHASGYKDDIGRAPRGKGAGAKAQRLCAVCGRHRKRSRCRENGRIVPEELLQQGGASLPPRRDRGCCSRRIRQSRCRRLRRRGQARGTASPGGWPVSCCLTGCGRRFTPLFREAHIPHRPASTHAPRWSLGVRMPHSSSSAAGRFPCCATTVADLFFGLRKVDVEADLLLVGKLRTPFQSFRGDGVGGVRAGSGTDPRVVHLS